MAHQDEEQAPSGEVAQALYLSRWRQRQAAWGARQELRHSFGGVEEQDHFSRVEREGSCCAAGHMAHLKEQMQLAMSVSSATALERWAFLQVSLPLQCPHHRHLTRPGTTGGGLQAATRDELP